MHKTLTLSVHYSISYHKVFAFVYINNVIEHMQEYWRYDILKFVRVESR